MNKSLKLRFSALPVSGYGSNADLISKCIWQEPAAPSWRTPRADRSVTDHDFHATSVSVWGQDVGTLCRWAGVQPVPRSCRNKVG
jgi:hypothetical protein